ncbi:glycosyl transferase [Mycolicibacterium canariasense]|nr:glycosyl transferase [Mycolicibacterium canariasense]
MQSYCPTSAGAARFTPVSTVDVSVVIPVRNGAAFISKQLEALLNQKTQATFEVIVADNGSTDETVAISRQFLLRDPRVRIADASRGPGANIARNVGITVSHGQFVLLTDADDVVHPGWIQAYWEAFLNGADTVGGGLNRVLADGTVLSRESKLYWSQVGGAQYANATNCGFTRKVFDAVGGFDENLIGTADEVEFFCRTQRAGYTMRLVPDAVVDKLQHTDLSTAFRQYFNFGRGETILALKFRPRLLVPGLALVAVQAAIWGALWATVGRAARFRRATVQRFAFNLGMLVEALRFLSKQLHLRRT